MLGIGVIRAWKGIALIISNEGIDHVIPIIKSLENSVLLIDGVSETVKHETRRQERGFLGMLLGTLGALVLGNMLTGKGVIRAWIGGVTTGRQYNNMDKGF